MSKSILIVDTPINCSKCKFSYKSFNRLGGNDRCILNENSGNIILNIGKPDWCPLKDIPCKKEIPNGGFMIGEMYGEEIGWNACVDEILKERD